MQELKIDSLEVEKKLIDFIRREMKKRKFSLAVVGVSGGLDSAMALYLACRALDSEKILALFLPYKTTSVESMEYAKLLARQYLVKTKTIDITAQIDAYFNDLPDANNLRRGNKMARERMSVLYDQAMAINGLVIGTSNKTERLLGYGTLYGDMACAFNPLGGLYKTQLRQLANDIELPKEIIERVPSAELWAGQSDEEDLGFTYREVDRLLYYMVDKKTSEENLINLGFRQDFILKVKTRIKNNAFKGKLPAIARI